MADNSNYQLEVAEFVQQFAKHSDALKRDYIPVWSEVIENYLMVDRTAGYMGNTAFPLMDQQSRHMTTKGRPEYSKLRDAETKNAIETLLAKLMGVLFPGDKPFVGALPRGREDAIKARTASKLLDYAFQLPGHYRAMYVAMKSMLLFGTGIVQVGWQLTERPKTLRSIDVLGGQELLGSQTFNNYPIYDDVKIRPIDIMDFLPDPGADNIAEMQGCGKYFRCTVFEAQAKVAQGIYDKDAVATAIAKTQDKPQKDPNDAWQRQKPRVNQPVSQYKTLSGIEFYGFYPGTLKTSGDNRMRVVTLLNGEVVRDRPWPFDVPRLPFFDLTISPIQGRFYGLGPGEGIRYQQDFLDFLLNMMADATSRAVHPPILLHADDTTVDVAKLRAWTPDAPIRSEHPEAIRTLPYGSDKIGAMQFYESIVRKIQSQTGAEGIIQGQGLGVNRASATEANQTFQMALDRPEMAARFIEQENLRPLGEFVLDLYQQNLIDTEELKLRVGEQPEPCALADIHGEFDIKFVGSRYFESGRQKLASIDRIIQLLNIPQVANWLPIDELALQILDATGYYDLEPNTATQKTVTKNLLLNQLLSQMGQATPPNNGNGELPAMPEGTPGQQEGGPIA